MEALCERATRDHRPQDKTTSGSARKAVFKRLKPGRYKFRSAAINAGGTSPYSAWAKVRIR